MSEKKFSKKHEWVSLDGDTATVGITKHATEMLGDIVFVEVPEPGKSVEKDGQAAVVESTKAASDVYSPISGEILEGNKSIVDDLEFLGKILFFYPMFKLVIKHFSISISASLQLFSGVPNLFE